MEGNAWFVLLVLRTAVISGDSGILATPAIVVVAAANRAVLPRHPPYRRLAGTVAEYGRRFLPRQQMATIGFGMGQPGSATTPMGERHPVAISGTWLGRLLSLGRCAW